MSTPSLGVSVTGSLTHVASMAAALFVLGVVAGYTGQLDATHLLFLLGILTWGLYMFLAIQSYREDRRKQARAKASAPKNAPLTKTDVLELVLKAREKYSPGDLGEIYKWLNDGN